MTKTLTAQDMDDKGNFIVPISLPNGKKIKVAIPDFEDYSWVHVEGETFYLNLVFDGHYT